MKKKSGWINIDKTGKHPKSGTMVIAIYKGVYDHRIVLAWHDAGGTMHYGSPGHPDGQGSQPATHWHPLPPLPR